MLGWSEDEKDEIYSDASSQTHTLVPDTLSDRDDDFDPDLPTGFEEISQASPAKKTVVNEDTEEGKPAKEVPSHEGNSEKIVPTDEGKTSKEVPSAEGNSEKIVLKLATESTESAKVSKPKAKLEINVPTTEEEILTRLHDDIFLSDLNRLTMLSKKQFKDAGHVKSGRYYLPEKGVLTAKGRKGGLLVSLSNVATFFPCAATYQRC